MATTALKNLLESQHVTYRTIPHSPAFTSQQIAALAHVPGREFAKTVIVRLDDKLAMAVLPANRHVSLQELREMTGCANADFATESEFRKFFPDCETGAMPPFGNLYGMEVYVSPELTQDEEIAFNAGTHSELIQMPYREYERLVHPHVMRFTA